MMLPDTRPALMPQTAVGGLFLAMLLGAGACIRSSAGDLSQTAGLFTQKCSFCHTIGKGALVGPDLAAETSRSREAVAASVASMSKNNITLTQDDIDNLVEFLRDKNAAASLEPKAAPSGTTAAGAISQAVSSGAAAPGTAPQAVPNGSKAAGQALFWGEAPLANGGLACASCHSFGAPGSDTLGPDLAGVAARMGPQGLSIAIEKTSFKVMQAAYKKQPVTSKEARDLTAYLFSRAPERGHASLPLPLYGTAGLMVLLGLAAIGYRGRITGVRAKLRRK
jgi:cytochrome c2